MDELSRINEAGTITRYGICIKIMRTRYQYTLRELASKVKLSHTYLSKIEAGQVQVTQAIHDHLSHVLNFRLITDEHEEREVLFLIEELHNALLFMDSQEAIKVMKKLESDERRHLSALWMVDYIIAKIAFYNVIAYRNYFELSAFVHELNSVLSLLDSTHKQRYIMYRGLYHYNLKDNRKAIADFKEAFEVDPFNAWGAFSEQLLGRTYSETYALSKGNFHLRESKKKFDTINIYIRAQHSHMIMLINYVKMRRFDGLDASFNKAINIAKEYGLTVIGNILKLNHVLLFMVQGEYQEAMRKLMVISERHARYYYYKAYLEFKQGKFEAALATIKEHRDTFDRQVNKYLLFQYGLEWIEASIHLREKDEKAYEKVLKNYLDEALAVEAFLELEVIYEHYTELLVAQRRYKEAYQLTETMIDITKQTME